MADDSASTTTDIAVLLHLQESERRNYWDATNMLAKGMAFYLAITAAVLGYVLARDLPDGLSSQILYGGIAISVLYCTALLTGVFGVYRQLKLLERLTNRLDKSMTSDVGLGLEFRKRRRVLATISACTFVVVLIMVAGMVLVIRAV